MAGKRPAGSRYPHVTVTAKEHDHQWCPVIGALARRAMDGKEQWGTRHNFPVVETQAEADAIRHGFYRARGCSTLRREGLPEISVKAEYDTLDDGTYRPWAQVYLRSMAKAEIARRVAAGEPLAYNSLRGKVT